MKKGIKNLAIATMVGVASMGLMTGCGKDEPKPYIEVIGLDTTYIQNEEINLEGAKILYYSDRNDATADEIKLTESMIANFNTQETGEKTMKVIWNNFELEIDYIVSTREDVVNNFVNAYNAARSNMLNVTELTETIKQDSTIRNVYVYNNSIYSCVANVEQYWRIKEDDVWYQYEHDILDERYLKNEASYQESLIGDYLITMFLPQEDEMSVEQLEGGKIDYQVEGDVVTYTIDFMELASHTMECSFKDGKIVGFKIIVPTNAEKTEFKIQADAIYDYSVDISKIANLPNADWVEGEN